MSYYFGNGPRMLGDATPTGRYAPSSARSHASLGQTWAFEDALERIGLKRSEMATPWATSEDTIQWVEQPRPPAENIGLYGIHWGQVDQVHTMSLGYWLPFLAVLTSMAPPLPSTVDDKLRGSPYRYYETIGVYLQSDTGTVPKVWHLIVLEARPEDDDDRGPKNVEQALYDTGPLMVMQREPYDTVKSRPVPPVTYREAAGLQHGGVAPPASSSPLDDWFKALPFPTTPGDVQSPGWPQLPGLPKNDGTLTTDPVDYPPGVIIPPREAVPDFPSTPQPSPGPAPSPVYDDPGIEPSPVIVRTHQDNTLWWVAGGAIAVAAIAYIAHRRSAG